LPVRAEVADVPFFAQDELQCGPASLAMALSWSGLPTTPDELVAQVYTEQRRGSLQLSIVAAARRRGRLAVRIDGLRELAAELAAGNPVLVLQILGLGWYPVWHYAVAIGYDTGGGQVVLHTGRGPARSVPMPSSGALGALRLLGLVVTRAGPHPALADEIAPARGDRRARARGHGAEAAQANAASRRARCGSMAADGGDADDAREEAPWPKRRRSCRARRGAAAAHPRAPELGLDLPKTTAAVLGSLDGIASSAHAQPQDQRRGRAAARRRSGKSVLLRADMDALPMPEDTGLQFASQNAGSMHACGHDAHVAMLVGAVHLLDRHRDALAGDVLFMFQPGEEGFAGARVMLEEGVIDPSGIARAFAIHIDPRIPVGRLASRPGALLASADAFTVRLVGRGGHASMPHDTIDPVPVACEIVTAIQTFVTRRIDAFDPAVITVTRIAGGDGERDPGVGRACSAFARRRRAARAAHAGLRRVVEGVAAAHEVKAGHRDSRGLPGDRERRGRSRRSRARPRTRCSATTRTSRCPARDGRRDFSFVLERVPGAMVFRRTARRSEHPRRATPEPDAAQRGGMAAGIALHAGLALRSFAEPD
jgi:hippurate hydrolase